MTAAPKTVGALKGASAPQDPRFTPQLHRSHSPVLCPVTALTFYRYNTGTAKTATPPTVPSLLLLAGEDGWLSVYVATNEDGSKDRDDRSISSLQVPAWGNAPSRRCHGRIRVFAEQAIQGIRVQDRGSEASPDIDRNGDILVWGGQSVALVTRDHIAHLLAGTAETGASTTTLSPVVYEVTAPDWIYDGLLPRGGSSSRGGVGALITAHNEVVPFRIEAASAAAAASLVLLGPPISPSRPVLYSAQLAWIESKTDGESDDKCSHLFVAAGTVFGEIVAWTCRLSATAGSNSVEPDIKVIQVFTGHEGSIFDVVISPEFDLGSIAGGNSTDKEQRRARLLASCSDDRTLRIWPLYLDEDKRGGLGKDETTLLEAHAAIEARETGFQNTFEGLAHRNDDKVTGSKLQQDEPSKTYLQSSTSASQASQASQASPPLATVMAHASRIWHVRFGELSSTTVNNSDASILVYSFGEDATAQEWNLGLSLHGQNSDRPSSSGLVGELFHLRTLSSHAGKNIWSAAVSPTTMAYPGTSFVATGGCDGKICIFESIQHQQQSSGHAQARAGRLHKTVVSSVIPLKTVQNQSASHVDTAKSGLYDGEVPKAKKITQKKAREEVFNSYAFLSDDQLLAATIHGRLLLGQFQQDQTDGHSASVDWTELSVPDLVASSLQNYNVVRSPRGGGGGGVATSRGAQGLAFIGNAAGQLFLFTGATGQLQSLDTKLQGKVDEIFFLPYTSKDSSVGDGSGQPVFHLEVIATTLFCDEAALLNLSIDTTTGTLLSESQRTLELPRKAPKSPASMIITAASRCLEYIILGSRNGQLCLYKPLIKEGVALSTFTLENQMQTRTKDAILSIVPLPSRVGHPPLSSSSFVVTARDGTYRIYTIQHTTSATTPDTSPAPILSLQHETATPFGPIVRDAWFIDGEAPGEPPELVICGFRSTDFVVWNETRQQELATVDCGGTHRTHTYLFYGSISQTADAGKLRFAFTRHSELHFVAQDSCAISPLKRGGHGREIRTISASSNGKYVATGSEDTVIRIWSNPKEASVERRCLSVLKLHNTGLHSLSWLGDDYLISAAGSEELFIWRVSTIQDSAYDGLAVICESSYPDSTSDKILRIMGLDASLDAEDPGAIFISVALSNSIIKTYRYAKAGAWQLLSQGLYTGACPTQLQHLRTRSGQDLVVLAAFADGYLTTWRAKFAPQKDGKPSMYCEYNLISAVKAHQNAIKALDLTKPFTAIQKGEEISTIAIFTAGDDDAIATTCLSWNTNKTACNYAFGKTFRVASAHAAAVTGARILEERSDTSVMSFTAVSCSNDQRVKAWRVLISGIGPASTDGPVRIQLLDDRYSAIADPGDVECIGGPKGTRAIVVGMGMETWSLE